MFMPDYYVLIMQITREQIVSLWQHNIPMIPFPVQRTVCNNAASCIRCKHKKGRRKTGHGLPILVKLVLLKARDL